MLQQGLAWTASSGSSLGEQAPRRWWIGFSGGLDSTALMLMAAQWVADGQAAQHGLQIRAVHVHHGLQPDADAWAEHCQRVASRLQIPLTVVRLGLQPQSGDSVEALAREARYRAVARLMAADGQAASGAEHGAAAACLITAHHRDDQLETVLLQWLRGAGPEGLSAMPVWGQTYGCPVWRPLLEHRRDTLQAWVEAAGLAWIDDPMNADLAYRRSQIRHQLLPLVRSLAPSADQTLLRSAAWCAEAAQAQRDLAAIDLAACAHPRHGGLSVSALKALSDARQKAVLRAWLPEVWPAARLAMLQQQACEADVQARPQVGSPTLQVYRWRDALWQWRPIPVPQPSDLRLSANAAWTSETLTEALNQPLQAWRGRLRADILDDSALVQGGEAPPGLPLSALTSAPGLAWVPMTGQRRLRQREGEPSRSLKQWVQRDAGLPPWLRPFYPVLIVPKPGFAEQGTVLWSAWLGVNVDHLVAGGPRVVLRWESALQGVGAADI